MENTLSNIFNDTAEILNYQICGFHQYELTCPVHLCYVSQNLCSLLDVSEEQLLDEEKDLYAQWVHPSDQERYSLFLQEVKRKEQTITEEYRLVKKDGTILYVKDTMTSKKTADGRMVSSSVLADITELKKENHDLRFLKETIPCGFLRYTCEKQPRITYINQKMMELLRFPEVKNGEIDYLEMYKSNIFLIIPMEERRRFSKYLDRVYAADVPIAGEVTLLRCDGTRVHVFGWVTKCVNEQGETEFQSVCMDVTERYQRRIKKENERYLQALTEVYDKIFEFNLDQHTVKCLHCDESSYLKRFENIAMQMEDALDKWIVASASLDCQDDIRRFFLDFSQRRLQGIDGKPPQITYTARSTDESIRKYTGVFIKVDEAVSFYCCREIKQAENTEALELENTQLKEKVRDLIAQFSDGLAAFEVSPDGRVKPLYASENVCEFFGYTKEEWLSLTEIFTPMETFVAYSEAAYEDFAELLRTGEAEFTYFDGKSKTERTIKAICSEKEASADSFRYIMLYDVEGNVSSRKSALSKKHTLPEKRAVSIRTFGYFDVFVGEHPIAFRNKKAKELFALLVDRKGGYVTSEEAISFLWEDESATALTLSRYRKVALRLKNTLEEYGISDVVEVVDGKRRIVLEKVNCDLYQYLSGKEEYAQLFKGSYLTNYSWGETTLGELLHDQGIPE